MILAKRCIYTPLVWLLSSHLQHTATHCNTLPHTATPLQQHAAGVVIISASTIRCNSLQHAATRCNTLQRKLNNLDRKMHLYANGVVVINVSATRCNTLQQILVNLHGNTHPQVAVVLGLLATVAEEEVQQRVVAVCCSVLQCVAVCCSVLQCVAVCCYE